MKIVYEMEDGAVAVLTPILESGLSIEEIAAKDVPAGAPYYIVEDDALPQTRDKRDSWRIVNGAVVET